VVSRAAGATAALLLAACGPRAPSPSAPATVKAPVDPDAMPIPPHGRVADFDFLVEALRTSYAHLEEKRAQHGVDLDALAARYRPLVRDAASWSAHERVMAAFAGEFHDAHLAWRRHRAQQEKRRRIVRLGLDTRAVDGKLIVSQVWPGSAAERAGVRVGERVLSVDGEPLAERQVELARLRSWSRAEDAGYDFAEEWAARRIDEDAPVPEGALELEAVDGARRTLRFGYETERPEALKRPKVALEASDGIARLTVRSLGEKPLELGPKLDQLVAAPRAAKQPLLIDLRDDAGGYDADAKVVAERLVEGEVRGGSVRVRLSPAARAQRDEWRTLPEDPERPGWSRPLPVAARGGARWPAAIAVLIDPGCRSACESLALILRAAGARLFGERSGGSSGAPIAVTLPRTAARVTIPAWSMVDGSGRPIEGQGIAPDEELRWARDDVATGRDPVAARAEAWLRGQ
jgi:carboxyl-terminal processing protease